MNVTKEYGEHLSSHEAKVFRAFCENATSLQLEEIVMDEYRRAQSGNLYYQDCYQLAKQEAAKRDMRIS